MDKKNEVEGISPSTPAPRMETAEQLPTEDGIAAVPDRIRPSPRGMTKVEFFDRQPTETLTPIQKSLVNRTIYSKRADQFSLLLLFGALVVLAVVVLGVSLNSKKYSLKKGTVRHSEEAVVDFYQGNSFYSQKVEEERAAKALILHNKGTTKGAAEGERSDQMEVTIEDQMSSMDQKLVQMRAKKLMGEAPRPANDMGPITGIPTQVKPTKIENFNAPADLKRIIPQSLQTNN